MTLLWLLLVAATSTLTSCSVHIPVQLRGDLFSATTKLEGLMNAEEKVVTLLESYLQHAERRVSNIKQYIQDYKTIKTQGDVSSFIANPVHAYLFVKRLTVDWSAIDNLVKQDVNLTYALLNNLITVRGSEPFPIEDDLHGAAISLVRLQDTYDLDMGQLAEGKIRTTGDGRVKVFSSSQDLSARDCLFLGKHSFNRGMYDKAIEWLEVAMIKALKEGNNTAPIDEIQPFLQTAVKVHDEILEKRGPRGIDWQTYSVPVGSPPSAHTVVPKKQEFQPQLFQGQQDYVELEHYTRLCRGEQLRPLDLDAKLSCRYVKNSHPYFILNPLKVEYKSLDPYIAIFHDFLTPGQIEELITSGGPKLMASKHRTPMGDFQTSLIRTSHNAWINENDLPSAKKITKHIEISTGLKASDRKEAEDYQVANYGIGGLYLPHTDFLMVHDQKHNDWERFVGDRIATLMVYLSDVDAGGATVFPRAGVTLWPKKGAAAFWWNLQRDGTGDELTRHGACPVLHGSKWVSNKWIRLHEQMLSHQCSLDRPGKFTTP